ncbi:hypothetical protein [Dipodfec virus UOA04_Rod_680]|nr:hypothetical protein [Dipodfec virus UOA04_Rod_680]
MKLDSIYILYKNGNRYFNTYEEAYFYRKSHNRESVYYVFTPTMQEFRHVGELYHHSKLYFNKNFGCDFYDIVNKTGFKQLQLI